MAIEKNRILLSICIPSYNRPEQLSKLLSTIDCDPELVEVVIGEDAAPRRNEVREAVHSFRQSSKYQIVYEENSSNLGYDGNFRRVIEIASGVFVLFLGDDDWFNPGFLDRFLSFLQENADVGYVLRSYLAMHPDGAIEPFHYLPAPTQFSPGLDVCAWLFKRSVTICGITFKRESALKYSTDEFDGTLLYQLHLVLEICLREKSVYSDLPVVIGAQSYRDDKPFFGASSKEKGRYEQGAVTIGNSVNFTQGFFEISQAFDKKHNVNLTELIRRDLSKYSYPFLSIQRKKGFVHFLKYSLILAKRTKINATWHYYLYTIALLVLGENACDQLILRIKRKLGYTPVL
jgi:abequosyltransferase